MGVDGAHNTVGKNVGAYNTARVLSCQGGRRVLSCRSTGYGPWPGLPVGDWIALLACRLGIWAGPGVVRRSQRCPLDRAFVGKPVHEGPRVYEPDNYVLRYTLCLNI